MAKNGNKQDFWPSYVDLMTNLFAVMLVLFVVAFFFFKKQYETTDTLIDQLTEARDSALFRAEEYEKILQLDAIFQELSTSDVLRYNEENHTFVAKAFEGKEIFGQEDTIIVKKYLQDVDDVGKQLDALLAKLNSDKNFSYLLVIEGYSANDPKSPMDKDREYNYNLSFKRAHALYERWLKHDHLDLRKYNTEILICGSGLNGKNRDPRIEANNKRFVIQIIPKVSRPDPNAKRKKEVI